MAEMIAYAIAGHHTGMPDREGDAGCLSDRLSKPVEPIDPLWREELQLDATGLMPQLRLSPERAGFQLSVLGRMIFSCLVDADFRDTESYYARVEGRRVDRDWPTLPSIIDGRIDRLDQYLASKEAAATVNDVNRLRSAILRAVRARAGESTGLFTLTVPTGGGKTLTSLAFGLDHARRHGLDRIIYAIPFTSVIDQTAAIFRDVLGAEHVVEHHSAIDEEKVRDRERQGRGKLDLAMEDWAAPVVLTTNVQLFESLFSNRPSRCRKLHNLSRAVIILDEAQTIPLPVLRPCVAMLDELARNYGTSIVLCTATQPALTAPGFEGGFDPEATRELAPDPPRLFSILRRVTIREAGAMTDADLVAALASTAQALVIVNSRAHALSLYRAVVAEGLPGAIHLTTRQYAAHRREILEDVRNRLLGGQPCRLIATSLVECGVDVDFPRVWRAEAGLDQIAQAAGRCNREGRNPVTESIVTVFRPTDHRPPREIKALAGDFARIADKHRDDLLSVAAVRDYFGEVYWRKGGALDAKSVIPAFKVDREGTDFAYRTVAEEFRLIESGLAPVIVARTNEPREVAAVRALDSLAAPDIHAGGVARALQTFIVQVPPKARSLLLANGHAGIVRQERFGDQFVVLTTGGLYRENIGLLWEDADYVGLENTIV